MKKAFSKVANALSFAHLAGIGSIARAEEDDKKDDDQAKKAKAKAAEDDEDKNDQDHEDGGAKGKAKGAKAEEGDDDKQDDDADAEGDTPDEEGDDKNGKDKSKAKADDEDDDSEMRGSSAAAAARRRERARCAAIFASKAAAKNPALAANLAFNTAMTRKEALVVLENSPAAAAPDNGRSARNPPLGAGGSMTVSGTQAVSSGWDRAFAQVNPRRQPK